jgi:hypothetical protein
MNRARDWSLAAAVAFAAIGCGQAHVHSDAANGALGNHAAGSAAIGSATGGHVAATAAATPAPARGQSVRAMCLVQPQLHRAAAGCDDVRVAGKIATPDVYKPMCQSDADCTEGRNGRCTYYASYWTTNGRTSLACTYDSCIADADCPSHSICHCGGDADANVCVPAKCRTDADCLEPSYCSPSTTFAGPSSATQYACRTCADECIDDRDCGPDEGEREQACLYKAELRHWGCMYPVTGIE